MEEKYHCPICNHIVNHTAEDGSCPLCKSPYLHVADDQCEAMVKHVWKSDATGSY